MPLNEIHAPVYIKGKYATPAYPVGHAFRLYFALGSAWSAGAEGDETNWRLSYNSADVGSVATIVNSVFTRAAGFIPTGTSVSEIALYESANGGVDELVHLNDLPTGNSYGSAEVATASSYWQWVMATELRPKFRFTLFDGTNSVPQHFPPEGIPSGDNGSLVWYFINSAVPFATNDGLRLTRWVSSNRGYNRRLARSYGRTVAP